MSLGLKQKIMKTIIDNKMYNSEKATKVASWNNGYFTSNVSHCSEELYITKKGNWFLYGRGGAQTKFSESYGENSWAWGSKIVALHPNEALEWLVYHDNFAIIEAYFSTEIEEG